NGRLSRIGSYFHWQQRGLAVGSRYRVGGRLCHSGLCRNWPLCRNRGRRYADSFRQTSLFQLPLLASAVSAFAPVAETLPGGKDKCETCMDPQLQAAETERGGKIQSHRNRCGTHNV